MYQTYNNFMIHSGGTKFYELLLIKADGASGADRAVLIRRWGKMDAYDEVASIGHKVGVGQAMALTDLRNKLLEDKRKSRDGSKYESQPADAYTPSVPSTNDDRALIADLTKRYGKDVDAERLVSYLNGTSEHAAPVQDDVDDIVAATGQDFEVIDSEARAKPKQPDIEIDRGDAWGSF